jgi:membrane protein
VLVDGLYYTALIVLIGGELNQVIEQHTPEGKTEGEKHPDAGDGA